MIAIENARLFNETQEALEQQTATAEVLNVISSSVADTEPVFDKILESCERLFGGDQNGISLVRDDGQVCYASVAHGVRRNGPPDCNEGFPRPLKDSYQGYVIRKGRVVHYPDIVNAPNVPEAMREHGRRVGNYSLLVAPMLWDGQGIGTIHVVRMPPRPYTERSRSLLKTFADQAVIAIQNARLFRETNEALERQTATAEILAVISESPTDVQPVFQAIAERARTLCKADVGATTRLDGGVVHLAGVRAQSTQAEGAMRAVFPMAPMQRRRTSASRSSSSRRSRSPTCTPNRAIAASKVAQRSGFRSILSVPLLHQGRAIGTIGVTRRESGRFADSAVALLQTFARQAVIAIENVRLFNETQGGAGAPDRHL